MILRVALPIVPVEPKTEIFFILVYLINTKYLINKKKTGAAKI